MGGYKSVLQVSVTVAYFAGVLKRLTIGEAWLRNLVTALMCFALSGMP